MGILARQNLKVFLSVGGGRVWLREMRCKYHLGSDLWPNTITNIMIYLGGVEKVQFEASQVFPPL